MTAPCVFQVWFSLDHLTLRMRQEIFKNFISSETQRIQKYLAEMTAVKAD